MSELKIENEFKFVLKLEFAESALSGWDRIEIEQFYHDGNGNDDNRFRYRRENDIFSKQKKEIDSETGYFLESDPEKVLPEEFEQKRREAETSLKKIRYRKYFDDEELVVDFFRDSNGTTYFVMAELEIPEDRQSPNTEIPDFIEESIIHEPKKGDIRFTSKSLSDPNHAKALYLELDQN